MTAQVEEGILVQFALADFPGLIVFGFLFAAGAGVVFLEFVDNFLIFVDLFEERF